jgi:hypothetical protein
MKELKFINVNSKILPDKNHMFMNDHTGKGSLSNQI